MNDERVYGQIIARVSAPELVQGGYIIPPRIQAKKFDMHKNARMISCETDAENVIDTIEETDTKKILVCVKTSKQLMNLMAATDFATQLIKRGYSYLYITSKTGAVVDGKKVNREEFFNTLNSWGKDPEKKFVVLHRSILSEGINVSELETVIFMRNMDVIEMTQTIGRVLRLGAESKTYGLCVVPVYSNVGVATARALQTVVDTVFEKGEMLDSVVRR
jgi:predicted helicase